MNKLVHVTPKKDLRVIDPETGAPLPAEGKTVTWSAHWSRRERDGDVERRHGAVSAASVGAGAAHPAATDTTVPSQQTVPAAERGRPRAAETPKGKGKE